MGYGRQPRLYRARVCVPMSSGHTAGIWAIWARKRCLILIAEAFSQTSGETAPPVGIMQDIQREFIPEHSTNQNPHRPTDGEVEEQYTLVLCSQLSAVKEV